jgi:hypothetical protein
LRKLLAGVICATVLLAACGGGGSSDIAPGGSSSSGGSGSGGSGSGGSGSGSGSATTNNVVNAIVDDGPAALAANGQGAVNIMYVSVTICAPGSTTTCQTINHIQVDTGSQGLRIISSALNSTMLNALHPVSLGGTAGLAECTLFVDGYVWGPLYSADVHFGGADTATSGESAPNIPVQVIETSPYPVPSDCDAAGMSTPENTVTTFGANGIIGVGLFNYDCDTYCDTTEGVSNGNGYYSCTNSGCSATLVPVASQVVNPVHVVAENNGAFDNNGVIIELPTVGANGAATVSGSLVIGIGTQSNNGLASGATVLTTDANGFVTTNVTSLGQNDTTSYFDSGSNGLYFEDSGIAGCTESYAQGFFCPASTTSLSANVTGHNNQVVTIDFSIAPADMLFNANPSFTAFSNLGGSAGSQGVGTFAWGLPFYYGHNIYTAMENVDAGGTIGPYFAF